MPTWLISFIARWGLKIAGGLLASALIAGGGLVWLNNTKKLEYNKGYAKARQDFPQTVNNNYGPIAQNTYTNSMWCFPLKIGKFGIGVCGD